MTDAAPGMRVLLDLGQAPSGEPTVRVRRVDVPTDFGTVWLDELLVLLQALLVEEEARGAHRRPPATDDEPASDGDSPARAGL